MGMAGLVSQTTSAPIVRAMMLMVTTTIRDVTGYTWNKKLFPDPKDFLKQLHDRNLKATLNLHPADGVRHFEDAYTDMCKALGKDPEAKVPIPFEPENREFMDAYFDILHRRLEDDGVDFWVSWVDSLSRT
jgi:alpha-glucosidase (family GH31 glycosyl hydrolase)